MLQKRVRISDFAAGILLCCALFCSPAFAQSGGIEVFAANTLFDEGWRFSQTHIYERKSKLYRGSSRISDPLDRVFEQHRFVTGVDYGLRPNLTLSALLPFVHKELRTRTATGRSTADSFGFGDVAIMAKYRVYKRDWKQGGLNLALIGGLEIPTGDTGARENGMRLVPMLQPGLGSWNPFAALSANMNFNRFRLAGTVFLKLNTEGAQDFKKQDFLSLETDAAYRFWHTKYPGPTGSAKIGLQWRHEERAKLDGRTVRNSGSDELLVRTGLTFHPTPSIDFSMSVDIPVYQHFRGEQLGLNVRTFIALGFRF